MLRIIYPDLIWSDTALLKKFPNISSNSLMISSPKLPKAQ